MIILIRKMKTLFYTVLLFLFVSLLIFLKVVYKDYIKEPSNIKAFHVFYVILLIILLLI